MAISWLSALKILPWADMIDYAPQVVSGAQKLWQRVRKKDVEPLPGVDALPKSPEALAAEIQQLQQQINELQTEQLELSKIIKELADQNQRLVQAVDVLRVRSKVLLYGFVAIGIALIALYLRH